MLDIGIAEVAVIFIVALLILGPERLPKAARKVGKLLGQGRKILNKVKDDVDKTLK